MPGTAETACQRIDHVEATTQRSADDHDGRQGIPVVRTGLGADEATLGNRNGFAVLRNVHLSGGGQVEESAPALLDAIRNDGDHGQ